MMLEIERKFILPTLPLWVQQYPCHQLEQAYLNTDPVIRIRQQDQEYFLTYKGRGLLTREEYNLPLNRDAYLHLLKKADGYVITKTRYCIPLHHPVFTNPSCLFPKGTPPSPVTQTAAGSKPATSSAIQPPDVLTIELDVFHPPFAPLILAEVEFPDEALANSFVPPDWFGKEVTLDPAFHNSSMSRQGLPPL